ncbi:hypothetical protein [Alsobacter sp. R-9]
MIETIVDTVLDIIGDVIFRGVALVLGRRDGIPGDGSPGPCD